MVPAERADVAPERRLVTLLFADLSGYTALCARLDPEDVHDVVRPAMRTLRSVAESFGGTVPGIQGDGFFAIYGAPVAHEDDAERAVRAAFALNDTLRRINAGSSSIQLPELHIGVNSGDVVVWGDDADPTSLAGDAVNVASRLCGVAAPGEICVGPRTEELTRGRIEYGEPTPTAIRGLELPVSVFRALGVQPDAVAGRRTPSLHTGFVGRGSMLRQLDEILAEAVRTKTSQVAVVLGDAGYGKSRLALEWSGSCPDVTVLSAGCTEYDDVALSPWSTIVPDLTAPTSQLRDIADDAVAASHRMHDFLRPIAAAAAAVVIVDDLHLAPPESLALLERVHAQPWSIPVVILGLARPDGWSVDCPAFPLGPLDESEMRDLLVSALGTELSERNLQTLMRRSGGNPLFLEECIRLVVEASQHAAADDDAVGRIPNSMRQFIAARLDALPPPEKSLLQDAAIAGDVVWEGWLSTLDQERDVAGLLDSLERRGHLRRVGGDRGGQGREFTFKHSLIREVAYESLSRRTRSARHAALGAWLTSSVPAALPQALLAHHFATAWELASTDVSATGPPDCRLATSAVTALSRHAAEVARSQPRAAERALRRAQRIVDVAAECFSADVMADILVARAAALTDMQEHVEALAVLDAAEAVAGRRARSALTRARALTYLSRFDEAVPVFDAALQEARASNDNGAVADVLAQRAYAFHLTDRRALLLGLHDAFDAYVAAGDVRGQAEIAANLSYELTMDGGAEFRRWLGMAEDLADLDHDLVMRSSLRRTSAFMAQNRGESRRALELARSAYADSVEVGATRVTVDSLICQLAATSALGLVDENERTADEALALAERLGLRRFAAMSHVFAARPRLLARGAVAAAQHLSIARALLAEIGDTDNGDPDLAEAAIGRDRGDWPTVSTLCERAVTRLEREGAGLYAVPVRLDLARATLGKDPAAAVGLLAEALDAARRHDTPQHGALAAACLEQAQLLTGLETSQRIGAAPERGVELDATVAENVALRSALRGEWGDAATSFGAAAQVWSEIGATVWLVRALVWQAEAATHAGQTADAESREVVVRLLVDLDAPAGVADSFAQQLAAATGGGLRTPRWRYLRGR